ncbi:restriction endonuclease subunit S, partial [Candidatus Woesearchaeota archaeon]
MVKIKDTHIPPGYKKTEVGVIPEEWGISTIGDLFHIKAGGDFTPHNSSFERSEQYPFPIYANGLENQGLYGFTTSPQCEAGSITVTARGTLGVAFYRDTPFTPIGRLLALQPKSELEGKFFSAYLNTFAHFAIESTGVPQLTAPQISRYWLPLPPLSEQRAIARVLSDVDGLLEALDGLIEKKR